MITALKMKERISSLTSLWLLLAALLTAGLAGCDTVHGWGHASSGSPADFGASVRIPLGK